MKREKLIEYLKNQEERISTGGFDLVVWKESVTAVFENALGPYHTFTEQAREIDFVEIMSIEELYPKKVTDQKKTRQKVLNQVKSWLDQLEVMDESEMKADTKSKGSGILKTIIDSLRNNLSGKELKKLKAIAANDDAIEAKKVMLETIRDMDPEIMQEVMKDVLTSSELWKSIKL